MLSDYIGVVFRMCTDVPSVSFVYNRNSSCVISRVLYSLFELCVFRGNSLSINWLLLCDNRSVNS